MLIRLAILLTVICGLVVPLSSGCLGLETSSPPQTENYTVSEGTRVAILNGDVNGDIRVETWGKGYVELTWTKSTTADKSELNKADVNVTESSGRLDIETSVQSRNATVSVDYGVKLPRNVVLARVTVGDGSVNIDGTSGDTTVEAEFSSVSMSDTSGYLDITAEKGKIRLEGTTGGAKLTTSDSPIEVVNADGDIDASTKNGAITITDCKGDMTLDTSGGAIRVSNLDGCVLVATTTNAPITIKQATAVEVAETTNAKVVAEFSSVGANGTTITVKASSVSLYLPIGMNADIELKTLSGDIITHSFGGITTSADDIKGYLKGTIGSGGNKIYVETSKGAIELYRAETT